jgi:hypothetical protein
LATLGDGSQLLVNATPTADTAQDSIKFTLNPAITGSTAALQGMVISQVDNASTGVYDNLVKIENLKTPETTTNGLLIQQNAASGTLTNGLQIQNSAGTLSTGMLFSGTIGKELQLQNAETIDNGTNGTVNVAADSGAITLKLTGTAATINNSAGNLAVTATSALNLTGAAASTWDIGANLLSLQTTGNGAITTGTGLVTHGGNLTLSGTNPVIATTGANTLNLQTASNSNILLTPNGTGTVVVGGTTPTVTAAAATSLTINAGTTGQLNLGTTGSTKAIQIGQTAAATTDTIGIGNSAFAGSADLITMGNLLGASSLTLQSGTAGTAVNTGQTNAVSTPSGSIGFTTGNAIGGTSNSGSITLNVGSATGTAGAINIGTSNIPNTINVGSSTLSANTQTINVGNNNTAGGTTNVTIGSGTSATGGTTAIQAKGNVTLAGANANLSTGGVLNVIGGSAGFQIGGVASTGNYLRGNGTSFVSSVIQTGDIPVCNTACTGNYISNTTTQQTANINILSAAAGNIGAQIQGATNATNALLVLKEGATPQGGSTVLSVQDSSANSLLGIDNSGNIQYGNAADHNLTVATSGASTVGRNLTIAAGAGGATANGGTLYIQGGAAGAGGALAGSVSIDPGLGSINGAVFIASLATANVQIGSTSLASGTQTISIAPNTNTAGKAIVNIGNNTNQDSEVNINGGNIWSAHTGHINIGTDTTQAQTVNIGGLANTFTTVGLFSGSSITLQVAL